MNARDSNEPTGPAPGAQLRPFHRLGDAITARADVREHPPIFVDVAAPLPVLSGVALARAKLLDDWLGLMETAQTAGAYDADQLAAMLRPLAEDVRRLVQAIDDRLTS